jgi:F0F1-type ATP synthase assembly protein I
MGNKETKRNKNQKQKQEMKQKQEQKQTRAKTKTNKETKQEQGGGNLLSVVISLHVCIKGRCLNTFAGRRDSA